MIVDGFDLASPLICEGVVGDGCGGGRLFIVKDEILFAYDPLTKERFSLLAKIQKVVKLSKKACLITVVCEKEEIYFDLSSLKQV